MSELGDDHEVVIPPPTEMVENILAVVGQMRSQQNAWNEEVHRFFLTEAVQKEQSDRLTKQVQDAEASSLGDGSFTDWVARRTENNLGEEMIKKWYHINGLLAKTPFVAIVPCPRWLSTEGRMELVGAVDALGLKCFVIQTIPLHLPLSKIASTFVPSAFHLPKSKRVSKSSLGSLPYVGVSCVYGGDALKLLSECPLLAAAIDRTPCLFLNDYIPRAALCIHSVTVGGACVAAEVACDDRVATKIGLDCAESERETRRQGIDVLSLALKNFLEEQVASSLENRSFRALLLAEAVPGRERDLWSAQQPLLETDLRFLLLNMDTLDGSEFECFTQQDILDMVQRMKKCHAENEVFYPVLRFIEPDATNRPGV
ncbi:hypothetical protein TraAM80_07986 [Trypanosoma rangeli]|uniref:Uncharacterized protein n=1 Tax=Trypanosoma rangeli TaxID=5698 RepID=A0A3R7K3K8_TRYRA|nr:uncharacterized protein TraAM80_07986 [Trypanosoma rangeli]RNE99859.1 hypothetical protein TraAM80_07986 [Trypanosoma rangeli]|eukprot:RNE99859.1 hypothetical protein TraAM80_07986 [Trypanosoma rangeli]